MRLAKRCIVLLTSLGLAGCSAAVPDEAFERTKMEVAQADQRVSSLSMQIETDGEELGCERAQSLSRRLRADVRLICDAAARYPDYAQFQTRCNSGQVEAQSSGTAVRSICDGDDRDEF